MLEIWKLIEGHPNYMISNHGRIFSLERIVIDNMGRKRKVGGKYLKTNANDAGYQISNIDNKKFKTHRLIAMNFIPNPLNLEMVDHIDRDRTNNELNNLRWVTRSMNAKNTGMFSNNTSGVKNIHFNKSKNKYQLTLKISKTKSHSVAFKTLEEAVEYKKRYLRGDIF
jgi:hypothetical protein